MLAYDPAAGDAHRLLNFVLLMSARDGAAAVRFEPGTSAVFMHYLCDGTWYELVPAPPGVWPGLPDVALGAASQTYTAFTADRDPPPDPGGRLARWLRRPAVDPGRLTGGVLKHRFAGRVRRWGLLLDTRRGRVGLLLTALDAHAPTPAADREVRDIRAGGAGGIEL